MKFYLSTMALRTRTLATVRHLAQQDPHISYLSFSRNFGKESAENIERVAGETKWSFWKLFHYAIDGIINFSQTPLSVASWFGIFMTLVSFLGLIFVVVRRLIFGDPVAGWASTICILLFVSGLQLFCLGIIGQYIAKIYAETKHRPHFIISESNKDSIVNIH